MTEPTTLTTSVKTVKRIKSVAKLVAVAEVTQKIRTEEEEMLAKKYQKKTDIDHILHAPDTYIGSIEQTTSEMCIFNDKDGSSSSSSSNSNSSSNKNGDGDGNNYQIVEKTITYIPGLYKLFDEGLVNARDHVIRMKQFVVNGTPNSIPVTNIEINIADDGTITMWNDGNGIDVVKHPDEPDIWIPEIIFGHLRSSTNYDKSEKQIVGGKNGFGFKLALIWSSFGSVETVDHTRKLKYYQEFKDNLTTICLPQITKTTAKDKPYTKITFKPDYARLGIQGLSADTIALFKKRVYDIAAITSSHKTLTVKFNGELCPLNNFQQYIDLYIGNKDTTPRVYEENGERWEYAVALSTHNEKHEFTQVSFVNGIHTSKGGKHVEYILGQIVKKMVDYIQKKKKIAVKAASIKEQLMLFLRCDIENPAFDSQTKDTLNTPFKNFGSECEVSDKFIEKLAKMGVMDAACQITGIKEQKTFAKSDGEKTKNIAGIPKLVDANWAGTAKSQECILILCEGDSAKTGILSGLTAEDCNKIGVFPLKGKLLNVRDKKDADIDKNAEITAIKKILGLKINREYTTIEDVHTHLRYSRIVIMCDQDVDGSHIKGLVINLFHSEWPSLSRIPGFIGFMNTPILKARRGGEELIFYNQGEYEEWQKNNENGLPEQGSPEKGSQWTIKYFKGLGTSSKAEFKEYFRNRKFIEYIYTGAPSDNKIDMAFNKVKTEDRKEWLGGYDRNLYLDTNKMQIPYEDFIQKELIHFSKYDNDRSIPNIMDGLKTSLRKILYAAFKKNLVKEIKVAQFSGYVSEKAAYHHGEASLNGAIIGMAQNFVGSNNINLLMPNGQFGSRLMNGKDHASERYIFTQLTNITRILFPKFDDDVLKYLDDDGTLVEPIYYVPILPMVLVNGSEGIGTGFSTKILCYNPLQISQYIKSKLIPISSTSASIQTENNENIEFIPYYEGFRGTISKITDVKFLIKGVYTKTGEDMVRVTELPIGLSIEDFVIHLKELEHPTIPEKKEDKTAKITKTTTTKEKGAKEKGAKAKAKKTPISFIKEYISKSPDGIDFTIVLQPGMLAELESHIDENKCNGLEKLLKLYTTESATNMHLFGSNEKLKKYNSVQEIIDEYFEVRLSYYQKRKAYQIKELEYDLMIMSNKARFIEECLVGTIDLRKKKREVIIQILIDKKYNQIHINMNEPEPEPDIEQETTKSKGYNYLIQMPMDSVSAEKVEKILKEKAQKEYELNIIKETSIQTMWYNELEMFEKEYMVYQNERKIANEEGDLIKPKTTTVNTSTITSVKKITKSKAIKK